MIRFILLNKMMFANSNMLNSNMMSEILLGEHGGKCDVIIILKGGNLCK